MTVDSWGLVGETIADKYFVEAVVDAGGTAVVYRASHTLMKRRVALKVFRIEGLLGEDDRRRVVERFVAEGRILAELSERTSAIVQARDVGTLTTKSGEWIPYMVLEWLEGEPLETLLQREQTENAPPRSLEAAVTLLDPVAGALELAHRRGIVHRDVKPSNMFMVTGGTLKLLDFGIAKVVEDARAEQAFRRTDAHLQAFTPAYGAPEQFSRVLGTTGPWTDVFALALVLLELVSGRAPLQGETIEELGRASTRASERPSMGRVGKPQSPAVESVFARAMSVEPSRRFASVDAFWTALKSAMASPASARAVTDANLAETLPRVVPPKRHRGAVLAVALTLVVASALAFTVFLKSRPSPSPSPASASASASALASASASALASAPAPSCPPSMSPIPGGSFFLGSDEPGVEDHERPAHTVTLTPYCIDKTEVTSASFTACVESGACKGASDTNAWPGLTDKERITFDPICNAREPTRRGQHPANCIAWSQANDYCAAQHKRLPTEAEWEHAARGSDGRRFPWGDAEPTSKRLNACGSECVIWGRSHRVDLVAMYGDDDGWPTTAPVGSFPEGASPYGVLDMTGNVWEWVSDRYASYDPKLDRDPRGPETGEDRVVRGGAWNGAQGAWVRPTYRFHSQPDTRSYGIGFRCASRAI